MKPKPTPWIYLRTLRFGAIAILLLLILDVPSNLATAVMREAPQENRIDRYLKRYRRFEMDPAVAARQVRATGELSLPSEDGVFNIVLKPHDVRAPDYRAEEVTAEGWVRSVLPEEVRTFRGTVRGLNGSEVRFSIRDDALEGIVLTSDEWYLVEPMRNYDPISDPTEMVIYRASDIEPQAVGTCGATLGERIGTAHEFALPQVFAAGGAISTASVATEADYEYVAASGGSASANNNILDIMNQVDGIYKTDLSISLQVSYQHTWATPDDPYASTVPLNILTEFRSHWSGNFSSLPYDLAHMWTGKNMDGSVIGIAYLGVVCNARYASYGVSQRLIGAPGKYILTAHEIGHNFGATHTEQASPPQSDCSNTIMNSSIGTGTNFCSYSQAEIAAHITQYPSCLTESTTGCDINIDSQVNVLDIQSLTNTILGTALCPGNCDANQDGDVDVLDVQLLINAILGVATCP